jgi:hypothetical protein
MIFLAAADAAFLEKKARKKSIKARETKFSDSARLAHRQSSNRVKILIRRPQCESCKRLWLLAVVKAIAGALIKGFREASICGKWSAVDLSLEPTTWPFHVRARKNPIKTSRKASTHQVIEAIAAWSPHSPARRRCPCRGLSASPACRFLSLSALSFLSRRRFLRRVNAD